MLLHIATNTSSGITSGGHNTYHGRDRASGGRGGHGGHGRHSHCGGRGGGTNANIINRPRSGRISRRVDRGDAVSPSS